MMHQLLTGICDSGCYSAYLKDEWLGIMLVALENEAQVFAGPELGELDAAINLDGYESSRTDFEDASDEPSLAS